MNVRKCYRTLTSYLLLPVFFITLEVFEFRDTSFEIGVFGSYIRLINWRTVSLHFVF